MLKKKRHPWRGKKKKNGYVLVGRPRMDWSVKTVRQNQEPAKPEGIKHILPALDIYKKKNNNGLKRNVE